MSWNRGEPTKSEAYLTTLLSRQGGMRNVVVIVWAAGVWFAPEGWRVIAWDYLPDPATIDDHGDEFCGTTSQGVVGEGSNQ